MKNELGKELGEMLPCPFCGLKPEYFGRDLRRLVEGSKRAVVDCVRHPASGNGKRCALGSLVFSIEDWNKRI